MSVQTTTIARQVLLVLSASTFENEHIRILASIRHIVAKTKGYVGLRNIIHLTISSNPRTATSTTQGPLPQPNAYWQRARFQQQVKSHTRRQGKNNAKRPCCETCIWSILQSILWWTEHSPWEASCTVNHRNKLMHGTRKEAGDTNRVRYPLCAHIEQLQLTTWVCSRLGVLNSNANLPQWQPPL